LCSYVVVTTQVSVANCYAVLKLSTDLAENLNRLKFDVKFIVFYKIQWCTLYILVYNIVQVIKSQKIRWAGHVARMGEKRGVYRVLVGKSEGKRPLGRPRRRLEDNINL
jgi:hypothetical protein